MVKIVAFVRYKSVNHTVPYAWNCLKYDISANCQLNKNVLRLYFCERMLSYLHYFT